MQNLTDHLMETIRLAQERNAALKMKNQLHVSNISEAAQWIKGQPTEHQRYQCKKLELERFLGSMDHEMIKEILTIMYLGRDLDRSSKEASDERLLSARIKSGSERYSKKRDVINELAQNSSLDAHLLNGMKILNLSA